eukprot:GHVU01034396.1.p1 GENE.GHVU01034396.1~~GHVU01034396.1.p1  ORF type:complete len:104 (-),score=6.75 GHVU01034396.1:185-496(-)
MNAWVAGWQAASIDHWRGPTQMTYTVQPGEEEGRRGEGLGGSSTSQPASSCLCIYMCVVISLSLSHMHIYMHVASTPTYICTCTYTGRRGCKRSSVHIVCWFT